MVTYGTQSVPADEITVTANDTVSLSPAFEQSVGIIGGMDTSNGTATAGESTEVLNPSDAANKFGDDSEIHRAAKILFANRVPTVYAVGVPETDATYQSGSDETSGTLSNTPLFDPNLHGDESVTATDDGGNDIAVNITYEDPPNTPSDSDTINLNPVTGDFEADASDTYTIDYTYGTYDASLATAVTSEGPQVVAVGTEDTSYGSTLGTELGNDAGNFTFQHGFLGADVKADSTGTGTYVTNFTDSLDDRRLSVVATPRGTDTNDAEVRTVWGVAAEVATTPLGRSTTNNDFRGYNSLRTEFNVSEQSSLIDKQVLPLRRDGEDFEIVKDQTTSTTVRFERIFSNQVVDNAVTIIHDDASDFVGEQNTVSNRASLRTSISNDLQTIANASPSQLDDYAVNVSPDGSDPNQVNVEVGLNVVDVMDNIVVDVAVGDVIQAEIT
jgi:hypothetical protein